jgi:hypothetical protein
MASASSSVALVAVVGLPVAVQTAAWAVPGPTDLRLFINRPGETLQLRVRADRHIEALPSLPVVTAGATRCGTQLIVTASDAGKPVALGLTDAGTLAWRVEIPGPPPTLWPLPGCAPNPVVLWQTRSGQLEVANVGAHGLSGQHAVAAGGPPLDITTQASSIWLAWADATGVNVAEISAAGARPLHVPAASPAGVAIGAYPGGAFLAWARGASAFSLEIPAGQAPGSSSVAIETDLGTAAGGALNIVSGPRPVLLARRRQDTDGDGARVISALALPGKAPFVTDRMVHAAAWWQHTLVAVGTTELLFLAP